ncbi:hypothetical protein PG990_001051 [Apiospora arundinis]
MAAVYPPADDIPAHVKACSTSFQKIVQESARLSAKVEGLDSRIEDEHARFELYVRNSGAARTGRSSLQYRLREASGIRRQVVSLLQSLAELLDDTMATMEEMDSCQSAIVIDEDIDELNDLVLCLARLITCLLRLLVAIRNPTPHDRFSLSIAETDTSFFVPGDVAHVKEKFPEAPTTLCERLGKANSYRRQYFKYRNSRHIRLEQGISIEHHGDGESTTASSIPQELKDQAGSVPESRFLEEDDQSESGQTQTTIASEQEGMLPLPAVSERGPFECPLCFAMISVKTRHAWERHVLQDLRCYICLYDNCSSVTQQFERRHDWIHHMRQQHWRLWRCTSGCESIFATWAQFSAHMSEIHSEPVVPNSAISRPRTTWVTESCPLCSEPIGSFHEYQQHIGEHQLDLALFVLPRVEYETIEPQEIFEATGPRVSDEDTSSDDAMQQEEETTKKQVNPLSRSGTE